MREDGEDSGTAAADQRLTLERLESFCIKFWITLQADHFEVSQGNTEVTSLGMGRGKKGY